MDINEWFKWTTTCAPLLWSMTVGLDPAAYGHERHTVGAPAVSRSNLSIRGGRMFEVRLNTKTFSADLLARSLAADGSVQRDRLNSEGAITVFNGDWRGQRDIDERSRRSAGGSANSRIIITSGSDGIGLVGRRFSWDHVRNGLTYADGTNEDLKSLVDPRATEAEKLDEQFEDPIVSWVRGNDEFEGAGGLRPRDHVLGHIVHSAPQYAGPPYQLYDFPTDPGYGEFSATFAARAAMVYLGGAMLHAFNAEDGAEVFAYIPHELLDELDALSSKHYAGAPLVDGTPTIADAFGAYGTERCRHHAGENSCWLSILVSGLGLGGKAIFALNVTDPVTDAQTEEAAAETLFLWEFTHDDLGLTTARPIVARLNDGTWVTIVGNGRGAGKAHLFVLDIATGELIQQLEVPSTSTANGLSSPTAWDRDFDGDVDLVYAGDLEGNLWRFDFSDAGASGNAYVSFDGDPLISVSDPNTAKPLPITTPPLVSLNPDGGLLVYFATGMNTQSADDVNGMFGVEDKDGPLGSNPALLVHSVENQLYRSDDAHNRDQAVRTVAASIQAESKVGWKLALPPGERILNDAALSNQRIIFTSVNPKANGLNRNWLNIVDSNTGGPADATVLDLNADGMLDEHDQIKGSMDGGQSLVAIGRALGGGVVSDPVLISKSDGREVVMVTRETETTAGVLTEIGAGLPGGSFDLDTFVTEGKVYEHTERYDDRYNIDGVNLLTQGGRVSSPPHVESASGILSRNNALRASANGINGDIYIEVINPFSADTPALADRRRVNGPDGAIAPALIIYFQCATDGRQYVLDAPSFNTLPQSDRTCRADAVTELRVRIPSVHGLRATLPGCIQASQTEPALSDMQSGLSGHYRNGASTIQARRVADNSLFWEAVVYQHVSQDEAGIERPERSSDQSPCDRTNAEFRTRAYSESERTQNRTAGDSGVTQPGGAVTELSRGTLLTPGNPVPQSTPADGRVSWREVRQ